MLALSHGLDHDLPSVNKNRVHAEFEAYLSKTEY